MKTWTEFGVHFRTGLGEWRTQLIEGPEPEHVGKYARKQVDGRMVPN